MSEPGYLPGQVQAKAERLFERKPEPPLVPGAFEPMSCGYDELPRWPWGALAQALLFTAAFVGLVFYLWRRWPR